MRLRELNIKSKPVAARAAIALCAVVLSGCGGQGEYDTRPAKSYYPPSAALQKYADDNSDCPLWSDWQSLCSYTKAGGGIECHDDPAFRVEPSPQPFCFKPRLSVSVDDDLQTLDEELQAMNRFCDLSEPYQVEIYDARSNEERVKKSYEVRGTLTKDICRRYKDERPFSGRNMASIHSPYCKVWKTGANKPICQSVDSDAPADPSLPSCEAVARAHLQLGDNEFATCHDLRNPVGCDQIWPAYNDSDCGRPPGRGEDTADRICTGDTWFPRAVVRGMYCAHVSVN